MSDLLNLRMSRVLVHTPNLIWSFGIISHNYHSIRLLVSTPATPE